MAEAEANVNAAKAKEPKAPKTAKKSWFKGLKAEFAKIISFDKL